VAGKMPVRVIARKWLWTTSISDRSTRIESN
jgi:hypothetical protein